MKQLLSIMFAVIIAIAVTTSAIADAGEAAEIKVSASLELFYEMSDDIGGITGDNDKFKSNQLYLDFLGKISEDTTALLKLDGADIVAGDGKVVSEKIVEEANFKMSNVGGLPLEIVLGKDEMPFGMDYDKYLNDSFAHMFEIDKVWGVNSTIKIDKIGSLSAGTFQHRRKLAEGQTRLGSDNELLDNYCAKLTVSEAVDGVKLVLSGSSETYANISTVDEMGVTTVSGNRDENRFGAGFQFDCPKGYGNINAEYISFSNMKGISGYDPALITLGVEVVALDPVTLWVRYEIIDEDDSVVTAGETDFWSVGAKYKVAQGFTLLAEYSNFNSADLKDAVSDLHVVDGANDNSLLLGVKADF